MNEMIQSASEDPGRAEWKSTNLIAIFLDDISHAHLPQIINVHEALRRRTGNRHWSQVENINTGFIKKQE
jgi:hypothetical protein